MGAEQGGLRQTPAGQHHLFPETSLIKFQLVQSRSESEGVTGEFSGGAVRLELTITRKRELRKGTEGWRG